MLSFLLDLVFQGYHFCHHYLKVMLCPVVAQLGLDVLSPKDLTVLILVNGV